MTNQEKIVARFLRQEQGAKSVSKYILRHSGKGSKGHEVESFDITESLAPEDMDLLAGTIHARAQMDADGLGPSVQRYTLTAMVGSGDDGKAVGRVAFRVRGESDVDIDEETESGEEAPTNRGLLTQLMRHNESNNRTMVGSMGTMLTVMARRMESSDRAVERLLEERTKMLEAVEDARTEQMERQLVLESERAKQNRIDFGIKKVSMLAPVVLDHLTGGKMGTKETPMTLMLKELIGSINPDQLQAIAKTLSAEQQVVFFQLFQSLKEKETNGTPVS